MSKTNTTTRFLAGAPHIGNWALFKSILIYLMYVQTLNFQLCKYCSEQSLHRCELHHFQDRPFSRYICDVTLRLSPTWIEDDFLCTNHLLCILEGRYLPVNKSCWKVRDIDRGHKTSMVLVRLGLLLKSKQTNTFLLVEKFHLLIIVIFLRKW